MLAVVQVVSKYVSSLLWLILLPKLERSGGGGRGCPVTECASTLFVDNDREFKLDIERLSSLFEDEEERKGSGIEGG